MSHTSSAPVWPFTHDFIYLRYPTCGFRAVGFPVCSSAQLKVTRCLHMSAFPLCLYFNSGLLLTRFHCLQVTEQQELRSFLRMEEQLLCNVSGAEQGTTLAPKWGIHVCMGLRHSVQACSMHWNSPAPPADDASIRPGPRMPTSSIDVQSCTPHLPKHCVYCHPCPPSTAQAGA